MPRVLVVDDEPSVRAALKLELRRSWDVLEAGNSKEALAEAKKADLSAVLLDITLDPNGSESGLDLIPELRRIRPAALIFMLTGHRNKELMVEALKRGASDYIPKPFSTDDLERTLGSTVSASSTLDPSSALLQAREAAPIILGRSPAIREIRKVAWKVAQLPRTNVLITGETGTGKDVLARYIHAHSPHPSRAFVAINCAAIPETLMESTLFGHEAGAFTGALRRQIGVVERANGGDLFLDEITSMPLLMQAKLLRVLETGEFERVGGRDLLKSHFRVISAANTPLREMVDRQEFREDLLYRLEVVPIRIPPLRERPEDIPLLVNSFLADRVRNPKAVTISAKARSVLTALSWPGNVRQLFHTLDSMLALCEKPELSAEDIPDEAFGGTTEMVRGQLKNFESALKEYERAWIRRALKETKGSVIDAAKALNISRHSLRRRMMRLGVG